MKKLSILAVGAMTVLSGCATYGPPPGYAGEGWRAHVRRCLAAYPNYRPRLDMVVRPDGTRFRCEL